MTHTISQDRTTLTVTVTPDEREILKRMDDSGHDSIHSDATLRDFLEPLTCNSELQWINPGDTGDLTSAPMLGIWGEEQDAPAGYSSDQTHTGFVLAGCDGKNMRVMSYQVRSVLEDLRDKGECVFTS